MGKQTFEKTKKILNIFMIIFCFLILATIPIALCYGKAPIEVAMTAPTSANISINETTNYQDSQWLATYLSNSLVVGNDMKYLGTALIKTNFTSANNNFTSVSTYANTLYKDSQRAINDSDLYSVSPDLQSTKDEYRLEMVQANSAAVYIYHGVKAYKKGNVEAGNSDMEQAVKNLYFVTKHANKTEKLLKAYVSTLASIPINETTNYQDSQWLTTYIADSLVVGNDMKYLGTALINTNSTSANNDFTSASKYSNTLYKDSQKAINDSDLYSVSPDLQSAKDEYQLEMLQAQSAAVYIHYGIEAYKKGNIEAGDSEMKQALQSINSVTEHANRAASLLKAYKSNN
jgi:cellobiose-specific phosphotransferase system component IIA